MSPEELEQKRVSAGEYVLGLLDEKAAREFEAAMTLDPILRREVVAWEAHLEGLSAVAQPTAPPPGTWDAIARRLTQPAMRPRSRQRLWDSLSFWRRSTAGAAALAAGLALYIALGPPTRGPSYVAILRPPQAQQDQAAWVATAGGNGLLIRAVARTTAPSDRSFELWGIAPGATQPQALGIIGNNGRLEIGALPAALRAGGTLAVSIEPIGGSPTGQPTGPVVFSGTLVAAR